MKLFSTIFLILTFVSLNAFSGHIDTNTTWSSDVIVTGDVWIDEGATLTISAGVTVSFPKVDGNEDGIGDIDFVINGRLLTQGTPDNKVIFTSLENDPAPSDWGGIDYLHTQSQNSNLQYTDILFAHQGLYINGKLFTINHGTVQECGEYGVRVYNSYSETTSLNNLTVFENTSYGLKVETSGIVNATGLLVSSNGSHGFWIENSTSSSFTNSRSVSNGGYGIYIDNSSPSFTNTYINSNSLSGVNIESAASNPVFDNCSVEYNDERGFVFNDGCSGTVEYSNIIGNSHFGIQITDNSNPVINYCNIFDNSSETAFCTEAIPSNELYRNSNGNSSNYTIWFPVNQIDQIHVSGYGDHNYYSDDYSFSVYPTEGSVIYNYSRINQSGDTSFDLWASITSTSSAQQLYVNLNTYSVNGPWGRVSEIRYETQAQLQCENTSGVVDASHNWWGQITGVDELIVHNPGTVDYTTMETAYINTAGASYTNIAPQFTLLTPDTMLVNPDDVTLSWTDMDVDDDAQISLYYDDGLDQSGILFAEGISEDNGTDSYLWDLVDVPFALYYVYGVIDDGENEPVIAYADGQVMVGPVSTTAPDDSHGAASGQVTIPINVANTYDYFEIISFQFIFNFDNLLLTANSVETSGTLTENWTVNSDMSIPGQITVNGFSANELTEGGVLCELVFDVDAGALDYEDCILNISTFEFNDGDITVEIEDGLFTVLNEYTISGSIDYFSNDEPVESAYLLLSGAESDSTTSSAAGDYSFPLHIAGDYDLIPNSIEPIEELVVTPYDASLVARYALGLETFSNEQITAGDVNGNMETNVYDAALIAQYSVDLIAEFDAGIWKFAPENFSFELTGDDPIIDFDAIVIGDPSGNWADPARDIDETIYWTVSIQERDNEDLLHLNAHYDDSFSSIYTKVQFSEDILQFADLSQNDVISDFQTFWQEETGEIIVGSFAAEPVQTEQKILSLEFEIITNTPHPEEYLNCEYLLFDENIGQYILLTDSQENEIVPLNYALQQNYPNPFNPETRIQFSLPAAQNTKLEIFNIKGQKVATLVDDELEKGHHAFIWNADKSASGMYFYKLDAGEFSQIKKMMLLK